MSLVAKGSLISAFVVLALSCATRSIVDSGGSGATAGTAGTSGTAGASGGAGGASGGAAGTSGASGSGSGGQSGSAGGVSVVVPIAKDADDVMWSGTPAGGWNELSEASPGNNVLLIQDDPATAVRSVGLRFQLDVPPNATIKSARLELDGGPAQTNGMSGSDSLAVRVFEPDVPFSPGVHTHQPSEHGTLSQAEVVIQYSLLGNINVAALLQARVASAAGWKANDYVGFYVAGRNAGTRRLNLGDTGPGNFKRANLHVTYVP